MVHQWCKVRDSVRASEQALLSLCPRTSTSTPPFSRRTTAGTAKQHLGSSLRSGVFVVPYVVCRCCSNPPSLLVFRRKLHMGRSRVGVLLRHPRRHQLGSCVRSLVPPNANCVPSPALKGDRPCDARQQRREEGGESDAPRQEIECRAKDVCARRRNWAKCLRKNGN